MTPMSDVAQGPGWWQANDGRWYPPQPAQPSLGAPLVPPATGPSTYPGMQAQQTYPWPEPSGGYVAVYRNRTVGTLIVVLGLAGLIWGVGLAFTAMAINSSLGVPHDEKIGAWIVTSGVLLAGLTTVVIGFLYRRN